MNSFKKLLSIALSLALAGFLFGTGISTNSFHALAQSNEDLTGKTVIFHTNDVHGQIYQSGSGENFKGGYAQLAGLRDEAVANHASKVLTMDAGDFMQGSIYAAETEGDDVVNLMNQVGYDYITFGNHEFDYGKDRLDTEIAKFTNSNLISSNIVVGSETGPFYANAYCTSPEGDQPKIGIIGIETPSVSSTSKPGNLGNLKVLSQETAVKLYDVAKQDVAMLRSQENCDIVIALTHLGVDGNYSSYMFLDNVSVDAEHKIDICLDGHSHSIVSERYDNAHNISTIVQQTGTQFQKIGKIVIDNQTKTVDSFENVGMSESTPVNAEVQAAAKNIKDGIDTKYKEVIAHSDFEFTADKEIIRKYEGNSGDLVADSILNYALNDEAIQEAVRAVGLSADKCLCVINGGCIRNPFSGDIKREDILNMLPFFNTVYPVEIPGNTLLEILEANTQFTPVDANGGFTQVAGIEFVVDSTKAYDEGDLYPGTSYHRPNSIQRVTIKNINGQPFDINSNYALMTSDFVALGGDIYYSVGQIKEKYDTGIALNAVVEDFMRNGCEFNPVVNDDIPEVPQRYSTAQGRIHVHEALHDFSTENIAPSCTEQGFKHIDCKTCQTAWDDDFVAALGHNFVNGVCTRCGAIDPNYIAPSPGDSDESAIDAQTGDANLLLAFLALSMIMSSTIALRVYRKR